MIVIHIFVKQQLIHDGETALSLSLSLAEIKFPVKPWYYDHTTLSITLVRSHHHLATIRVSGMCSDRLANSHRRAQAVALMVITSQQARNFNRQSGATRRQPLQSEVAVAIFSSRIAVLAESIARVGCID